MSLRRLLFSCSVVALFVTALSERPSLAADATAATPLKVLRHLEFFVTVGESTATETKVSGFDGGSSASGSSTNSDGGTDVRGTISIDVVAATGDGGLVVDVSENAAARTSRPVRVGILSDKLLYDPGATVTDEERTLLLFLARDFVKPTELSAGTTWRDDASGSGMTGETTYVVKSIDDSAKTVALDFAGTTTMTGPNGFRAATHGSMTYDTAVSVPLGVTVWRRTNVEQPGRLTTIDTKLSATLRADSLRTPKA